MAAERYEVKPGDTIIRLAAERGFRRWETIWEDDGNQKLRQDRKNPDVLHPGDIVMIPEKEQKQETCSTTMHHVFQAPVLKTVLRIRVEDADGTPMANKPYVLRIGSTEYTDDTDENGILQQLIPATAREGELEIEACLWPLEIGHLNPVDETTSDDNVSGAQARLNNLGYECPYSGELDDETKSAIKAFQSETEGLKVTGELDDDTRKALRDRHGS